MYCTGETRDGGAFPIYTCNADCRTSWTRSGAVFSGTRFPPWAGRNFYWAPEVHRLGDDFICYFCTRNKEGRFCIGAAKASNPAGPFKPAPQPIVSNPECGLIDPTYFEDPISHRRYLLWKEDRNAFTPHQPTPIALQELQPEGTTLTGEPHKLIQNDAPWEGPLVEAPSLIFHDRFYYLFYSANIFSTDRYNIGVARARNVDGPYEKFARNPILKSNARFDGPGHQYLLQESDGNWTIFYHARDRARTRNPLARLLMSDHVTWTNDGWPRINDGFPSGG